MSYPAHRDGFGTGTGSDAQSDARRAAGIEWRNPTPRSTEKLVTGLVAVICEHCGCTYAKVGDGKRKACDHCGKMPAQVHVVAQWDPTTPNW